MSEDSCARYQRAAFETEVGDGDDLPRRSFRSWWSLWMTEWLATSCRRFIDCGMSCFQSNAIAHRQSKTCVVEWWRRTREQGMKARERGEESGWWKWVYMYTSLAILRMLKNCKSPKSALSYLSVLLFATPERSENRRSIHFLHSTSVCRVRSRLQSYDVVPVAWRRPRVKMSSNDQIGVPEINAPVVKIRYPPHL